MWQLRLYCAEDNDRGAGADPARPCLDHRLGVGECPDAACGLDADSRAHCLPHQRDIGEGGSGAPIAGRGLYKGRPGLDGKKAGADLLLLRKVARLDDDLDGTARSGPDHRGDILRHLVVATLLIGRATRRTISTSCAPRRITSSVSAAFDAGV